MHVEAAGGPLGPSDYTKAQLRIIEAATVLFAEHGVSATSLQMIADAIGVTKAAVYHRFPSKEQIILAVAEVVLTGLEAAVEAAEKEPSRAGARRVLIDGMIELGVQRRPLASILQRDPTMLRFVDQHEPFQRVMERLYRVLMGGRRGAEARARAALVSSAIAGVVIHPLTQDLDDAALRSQLALLAPQCLRLLK